MKLGITDTEQCGMIIAHLPVDWCEIPLKKDE